VTEVVTGLDLVRLQIQIASGDALPLDQMDVRMRGHAVEARLYAEDASAGFLPATGTITVFSPPAGPGIRNDVGVEVGSAVTPHYDPILAKLVAHAETRDEAVTRLRTALEDYGVLGATTNQAFLHWVTTADDFVVGHIDTGFVDQHWDPGDQPSLPDEVLLLAAAWNLAAPPSGGGSSRNPWHNTGGWRTTGVSRHFDYVWNGEDVVLAANRSLDGTWSVRTGDRAHDGVTAVPAAAGRVTAILAGAVVSGFVVEAGSGLDISWRGITYRLERPAPGSESSHGSAGGERESLMAPMPGTITRVLVQSGDAVTAHQPLVIMEAMKMEHVIEAPRAGVVRDVLFAQGDLVPAGSALIRLEDA
jgi:3-methylcrotonyl-CoA carboxylase alpha subunit